VRRRVTEHLLAAVTAQPADPPTALRPVMAAVKEAMEKALPLLRPASVHRTYVARSAS
jgi:hypothetical protein